jgi:hypothetical protein
MAAGGFEEHIEMDDMDDYGLSTMDDMRNTSSLSHELMLSKVNSFYDHVGERPEVLDPNQFEYDRGHLFVKKGGERVYLTHKNKPDKFRSLNTIKGELGGEAGLQRYLGVSSKRPLPPKAVSALQTMQERLPTGQDLSLIHI